jgi:hypothetical protein
MVSIPAVHLQNDDGRASASRTFARSTRLIAFNLEVAGMVKPAPSWAADPTSGNDVTAH